jgi:LPXTG-site transpeptidase (sortase) family protein
VGVLAGLGAARAASAPSAAVPVGPEAPPIRTYPARLQDQPARVVNRPVAIHIGVLGVDAPVVPVGVVPDSNLLEAPANPTTTGWYKHGPAPGEGGSAVIAGHVDYAGVRGVFFGLRTIEPGAAITVDYQDGSTRTWRVVARRQYQKTELPTDMLFARQGSPSLTLVTCGGLYDASRRSYRDNVVVFAVPA